MYTFPRVGPLNCCYLNYLYFSVNLTWLNLPGESLHVTITKIKSSWRKVGLKWLSRKENVQDNPCKWRYAPTKRNFGISQSQLHLDLHRITLALHYIRAKSCIMQVWTRIQNSANVNQTRSRTTPNLAFKSLWKKIKCPLIRFTLADLILEFTSPTFKCFKLARRSIM